MPIITSTMSDYHILANIGFTGHDAGGDGILVRAHLPGTLSYEDRVDIYMTNLQLMKDGIGILQTRVLSNSNDPFNQDNNGNLHDGVMSIGEGNNSNLWSIDEEGDQWDFVDDSLDAQEDDDGDSLFGDIWIYNSGFVDFTSNYAVGNGSWIGGGQDGLNSIGVMYGNKQSGNPYGPLTVGGSGDDTLISAFDNGVTGTGTVHLAGGHGADFLIGSQQRSTVLYGGEGDDHFYATVQDKIYGGNGSDTIVLREDDGDATIVMGAGNGFIDVGHGTDNATFESIENIVANDGNNLITGTNGANYLWGRGGSDALIGNGGADVLHGDTGQDFIDGGSGSDVMFGGADEDVFALSEQGSDDYYGGDGDDFVLLHDNHTTLNFADLSLSSLAYADDFFESVECAIGSQVNGNQITGDAANNTFIGGANVDGLFGGGGDDFLAGLDGSDSLNGGQGNDFLMGGSGAFDMLEGGGGSDVFYFVESEIGDDLIKDFVVNFDTLILDIATPNNPDVVYGETAGNGWLEFGATANSADMIEFQGLSQAQVESIGILFV